MSLGLKSVYLQTILKDFLIGGRGGGAQLLIYSTGHIEWVWHRLKTWGGTCPRDPPGSYAYAFPLNCLFSE